MSLSTFQSSILASCRGAWTGELDALSAADSLFSTVGRGFEAAFREGQKECGILPADRTEEESATLTRLIGDSYQHVGRLVEWIVQHNKASGAPWEMIKSRAALWTNRHEEVKNTAMALACKNSKLLWRIDGGEHCRSCLKLNGRVHRASVWAAHNIAPRMITHALKCGGYHCKCSWVETDLPATRGRFPNLP